MRQETRTKDRKRNRIAQIPSPQRAEKKRQISARTPLLPPAAWLWVSCPPPPLPLIRQSKGARAREAGDSFQAQSSETPCPPSPSWGAPPVGTKASRRGLGRGGEGGGGGMPARCGESIGCKAALLGCKSRDLRRRLRVRRIDHFNHVIASSRAPRGGGGERQLLILHRRVGRSEEGGQRRNTAVSCCR